jgi:uncharacterized protein YxeA
MIFAAVIVCLMGIMYQANTSNTFYPGALDGVTAVVMITIISAIFYFATVVITEMVILYNETASHARAKRAMSSRGSALKTKESKKKLTSFDSEGNPVEETFNTGAIDSMVNPIFVQESRKESGATGSLAVLLNQFDAPSQEQWATCKLEIEEALRAAQQSESGSGGGGGGARGTKKKKDFAPVTA